MKRMKIFSTCLDIVAEEMDITRDQIISDCKNEDVVDARHLLVKLLTDCGLYPSVISQLIGCTSRNINVILSGFKLRCDRRKLLRINYERVRNQVGNISFTE